MEQHTEERIGLVVASLFVPNSVLLPRGELLATIMVQHRAGLLPAAHRGVWHLVALFLVVRSQAVFRDAQPEVKHLAVRWEVCFLLSVRQSHR
jgi:hypothetical protein